MAGFFNRIGRSLPVVTTVHVGQAECKPLVSPTTIDWSAAMQMGGQARTITQLDAVTCGTLPAIRPVPIHNRCRGSSVPGEHLSYWPAFQKHKSPTSS